MATAGELLPDGIDEASAVSLLRHLEWERDRFSIVFLFADIGPAHALLDWLSRRLSVEGVHLTRVDAGSDFEASPEAWLDDFIASIESGLVGRTPLALTLHAYPADPLWNDARSRFMARLNERRHLLESRMKSALLLLLPHGYKATARRIAPDLWHVRAISFDIRLRALAPREPAAMRDIESRPTVPDNRTEEPVPEEQAWADALTLAGGDVDRVYLPLSSAAMDALMAHGRLPSARRVAQQALEVARIRSLSDAPESLRDLSVSLNKVGGVARAQGDWSQAEAVYRESLALSRQLVERLGATPESLRDLSVSLDNVGGVARAQGDWSQAEAVYRESLAL
ncbi:tetratricopeptide repeat protein, partial [Methyloversatilis sp.]|uniref:tetratricopeptide repeat protein n=1 Tax=Methyloversatilis sp. TaxID=2569862 RepID=UPI0035B3D371